MKTQTLAFMLAIFIANASASDYLTGTCLANSLQTGSYSFVAVSLALVGIAITLAYMYSKFREDPQMSVWAKDEAYNLVISLLLFSGILAFVAGSCALAESYAGQDPFSASTNYIDRLVTNNGLNMIKSLTHQSLENQKSATAYLYLGVTPFYGEGVAKSAGYRALSSHKELVIDMYLPMIASLNAQKYILQGMEWVSLSILLPFAFVLRIIPFTRDYGNLLISLFFAMYIIAPTTYAMGARVFNDIAVNEPVTVDFPTLSNFNSYGLDGQGPVGASTVLYRVGITIPQAVFLPNFVLIIGITATMSISKALRAIAV